MPKPQGTRRRKFNPASAGGLRRDYYTVTGALTGSTLGTRDFTGKQVTVSEGHHWPPDKNSGLNDAGGPFYTSKSYVETLPKDNVHLEKTVGQTKFVYDGDCYPKPETISGSIFPPESSSSDVTLAAFGTTAIARCAPTNPAANASTFLGELIKDGLPSKIGASFWESKIRQAHSAKVADEYLNVQFGWLPMVSDISKFAESIRHANQVIAQYERDAGKVVRRHYRFPSEKTQSEVLVNASTSAETGGGAFATFAGGSLGQLVRRVDTTRDRWFSGAFTYYLPSGYDSRSEMERIASLADKLFGVKITPEVLWNVAPWSWAVDWFVNAGDVLHNIDRFATGGLIMPYGYMMERTITKYTYNLSTSGLLNAPNAGKGPLVLVTETKKRIPANPYGFGVTWNSLSGFQASILAALGISRRS